MVALPLTLTDSLLDLKRWFQVSDEERRPINVSEQPKELLTLQKSVASLGEIQTGFDEYQESHFTSRPPEFFALELTGEAGELANLEKKVWRGNEVDSEKFCDEAADVFITLMNYCNARGVDLAKAVEEKLGRIEVRRQNGRY